MCMPLPTYRVPHPSSALHHDQTSSLLTNNIITLDIHLINSQQSNFAAKSVKIVEFSGPKSETAVVTLIDGTQFFITDIYESPVDPRSPLKLIATCRINNVPIKSVGLQDALVNLSSPGSKKKKVYMNKRVQKAADLEREKKERMDQDEVDRLAEIELLRQK
eukprot:scaffold978_cov230-Chaetoceros_neogracile.AAC.5